VLRLGLRDPDLITRLTHFHFGQHRVTNFEMETAALYGLSNLLGHHCLSLSAIVANRITGEFSPNAQTVIEKLIRKTLEAIDKMDVVGTLEPGMERVS
jgi:uridine phosphorylase